MVKKILFRIIRILSGKKGIYGKMGRNNRFDKGCLIYENANIGNNNYFSPYVIVNNAKIGNFNSIGPGSRIGLGDHDYSAVSTYPKMNNGCGNMELFHLNIPSVIENDVWIGTNVVIMQGVTIGTGAVIGSGAVVTHDVPPYAIAVGVPAKVIKYRFDEERIRQLLDSKWYEQDFAQAVEIVKALI